MGQFMKKVFLTLGMLLMAAPAYADITTKMSASVQLTVDAAASQATRLGSSYSVSGSNVSITTEGGLGSLTAGSAVGYTATDYSAPTDGTAYRTSVRRSQGETQLHPTQPLLAVWLHPSRVWKCHDHCWWGGWRPLGASIALWRTLANRWRSWHFSHWPV